MPLCKPRHVLSIVTVLAVSVLAARPQVAGAQELGMPPAQPVATRSVTISASTLQSILDRLDTLEARMQKEEEESSWLDTSGAKFKNKIGGRIMGDYVMFPNQNRASVARFGDLQNYTEFRRMRIFFSGEGYGVYIYKFDLGFEPEGQNPNDGDAAVAIKDMYIGAKHVPWLGRVELGHVKEPYSLEMLTSSKYIKFMERAMAVGFRPTRRVGFRAKNHSADESWLVHWAVFFDDVSDVEHERVSDNQGLALVGRIVNTPYYCQDGRYLVHLGLMGAWNDDRDNSVRVRTRPEIHEGPRLVDSGTITADTYYDMGFQGAVVWGPASVQSEVFYKRVLGTARDYDFYGAYVFASYFLTGEHRPYKRTSGHFDRIRPFTNLWFVRTADGLDVGWGAWELAARWSYFDVRQGPGADAGVENNMAVGVNWYWNPHMRMMLDWTHAWTKYNIGPNNDVDILGIRFQVDY